MTINRFGIVAGVAGVAMLGVALGGSSPAGAASSPSASVEDDTLTVTGTSRNDVVVLRVAPGNPGQIQVDFGGDGSAEHTFDRTTFSRIEVDARSGNDTFWIDQANGNLADEVILVDGGSGRDTLAGGDGNEVFVGGSGQDAVDGNRGADKAFLGTGQDSFTWDPGDGSDVIEGQSGTDTLAFNGANVAEDMRLSPNGARSLFFRNVGNITMDMDDVERLDLPTLGGADTITVEEMSGTDFRRADVNLGGADGAVDTVTVDGTPGNDDIRVRTDDGRVDVEGLQTEVRISGSEPTDRLAIDGRGGNDDVDIDDDVATLITIL